MGSRDTGSSGVPASVSVCSSIFDAADASLSQSPLFVLPATGVIRASANLVWQWLPVVCTRHCSIRDRASSGLNATIPQNLTTGFRKEITRHGHGKANLLSSRTLVEGCLCRRSFFWQTATNKTSSFNAQYAKRSAFLQEACNPQMCTGESRLLCNSRKQETCAPEWNQSSP